MYGYLPLPHAANSEQIVIEIMHPQPLAAKYRVRLDHRAERIAIRNWLIVLAGRKKNISVENGLIGSLLGD